MVKASTFSRCRTSGTVFGGSVKSAITMVSAVFVSATLLSCVSPSPKGEVALLTVSDVQQGAMEKGVPLRWGGTIAKVHNKSEKTILEIVSRPLLRSGQPRHNDLTDGRFLAEINGFLDPEIVKPGRDISVIGLVGRLENGRVGEADYRYPVMSVFDYRFWKKADEIDPSSGYPHYFSYDRIWRDWPERRRSGVVGGVFF